MRTCLSLDQTQVIARGQNSWPKNHPEKRTYSEIFQPQSPVGPVEAQIKKTKAITGQIEIQVEWVVLQNMK